MRSLPWRLEESCEKSEAFLSFTRRKLKYYCNIHIISVTYSYATIALSLKKKFIQILINNKKLNKKGFSEDNRLKKSVLSALMVCSITLTSVALPSAAFADEYDTKIQQQDQKLMR